ncbi:MAG: hypothetical protein H6736_11860 [Alphaproteobacteria bacterium]|nr:hypothetical protein [Alphaproteobacteria bacterium]MCB9692499.1 hypothetical protein [Alphaproteobacteria bacterium]
MRDGLARRILEALDAPGVDWTELALDVHRWQHAHDPVVRALSPAPATTLDAIPAVPVGLFRDLDVGTVDPAGPHVAFHTSGTTTGRPGVHRMRDTVLYDAGCMRHARPWLPRTSRTVALLADSPVSSLAHMVRGFAPVTGPVTWLVDTDGLHLEGLERVGEPTFLCTTAFALDAWLATDPPALPDGSAILVTGGFKGRRTHLDAGSVVDAAVLRAPVVQEYGMTELSSQLWSRPGEPFEPPHWLRVTAVDPASGVPLGPGEVGQLRFLDLCNLDGTLAIETLDQGVVHPDGRVTLHGRLPDAPARGCSLAVEDLL